MLWEILAPHGLIFFLILKAKPEKILIVKEIEHLFSTPTSLQPDS